jgi:lipopolysaccharide/colanic/teichoic acid biosynthesis glycosyltransferase
MIAAIDARLPDNRSNSDTRTRGRAPVGEREYLVWKKRLDFAIALPLLIVALPVILAAVLLTKLTSRGPAIYKQLRLGLNGRPFTLYKIRTMTHNCERTSGACWSVPGDPRVTWLGRMLRRTKVDELPQLWNVLCGEMSLIGPRPERPLFVYQLERAIPHYRERLLVPPGLSGLAQVQLPADVDLVSVERKLQCDLYYVQNASLLLDLKILVATGFYLLGIPFRVIRFLVGMSSERIGWGEPVSGVKLAAVPRLT